MHFDLTDLRLFAAVVERGSITAGAAQAGLALPSASARIRGMEAELGAALLERDRRGVRPTPAGLALDHHARLVLERIEHLRGDLRRHARGGLRGHVRILSNTAGLEEYLPDRLGDWLAAHPGVDVDLEERPSHQVAPAIAQGHAEIGVLADLSGIEDLEVRPFAIDRLVLVLPRDHPLARQRAARFRAVLDEDMVGLAQGSALADHLAWQATRVGRSLRARVRLRSFDAVCRMVERGIGVAVVPEAAARRCRRVMAIRIRRLDEPWSLRPLVVCMRRLDGLSPHARALVEHLTGPVQPGI
ncbi:LysR family transcriptional regulator [Marinivivus vitaminiproducens]|uniref:LysR family transcriptional regulator n=1 Tax=Marinivivus vitaminiproducens TaxID=3035935 RepID=UPI00279DA785|nr:LysR family transcriptional regulator [Geminicoccaceae bacterium SCSIO 64248]